MSSVCVTNYVNDTIFPVRGTYINLYKWPQSDAEFVKNVKHDQGRRHPHHQPRVVDSVSCRQMYLRSYTFSRKESVPRKTKKCLAKVREKLVTVRVRRLEECTKSGGQCKKRGGLCAIFQRLLSCTTSIDIVVLADH